MSVQDSIQCQFLDCFPRQESFQCLRILHRFCRRPELSIQKGLRSRCWILQCSTIILHSSFEEEEETTVLFGIDGHEEIVVKGQFELLLDGCQQTLYLLTVVLDGRI